MQKNWSATGDDQKLWRTKKNSLKTATTIDL